MGSQIVGQNGKKESFESFHEGAAGESCWKSKRGQAAPPYAAFWYCSFPPLEIRLLLT